MLRSNLLRVTTVRSFHRTPINYSIVGSAKDVLHKANLKTGEILASTMETAEKIVPHPHEAAKAAGQAADKVNKTTGKVAADAMDKAEQLKHSQEAKSKVTENAKGYKDLQDKGSKTESEQNRPEDGF